MQRTKVGPAPSDSAIKEVDRRVYGLTKTRWFTGSDYGVLDLDKMLKTSINPIEHWVSAYLHYYFVENEGSDKTSTADETSLKEILQSISNTTGIVAALVASIVFAALNSPPKCNPGSDTTSGDLYCNWTPILFQAYTGASIFSLITCLAVIIFVTISSLWLGVHRTDEIAFYVKQYYVFAVAIPATCMSMALCGLIFFGVTSLLYSLRGNAILYWDWHFICLMFAMLLVCNKDRLYDN